MKKLASLTLAIMIATIVPGALGAQTSGSGDLPVLRVALMPYLSSLPAKYLVDKGWDVENGFKVEIQIYPIGAPLNEALAANLWDVGTIGAAVVFSIANYDAIAIGDIMLASGGTGAFIRPDSPAAKIKGAIPGYPNVYGNAATVKGATALVPVGSLNHFNVMKWIEVLGLTPADINIVHMDNAASFQAFKAGRGDVTAFSPPLTYSALAEGWINAGGFDDLHMKIYDSLIVNSRSYGPKKELISKFVTQFYRACDALMANTELAAQLELKWQTENGLKSTIENARIEVKSRPFVTTEEAKKNNVGESILPMAQFFVSVGNLEKDQLSKFDSKSITKEIINIALK